MPKPIDIHEWDRDPADRILTWSLTGPAFVTGDQVPILEELLHDLTRAGLADHRIPERGDLPDGTLANGMWVVTLTHSGQSAGLMLAASEDLVQLLDLAARVVSGGVGWTGVDMRRLIRELDLRMGGDGEIADMGKWLRDTSRDALRELPRRGGLDAPRPQVASA